MSDGDDDKVGDSHGGFQDGLGDWSFENFSLLETEEIEVIILR